MRRNNTRDEWQYGSVGDAATFVDVDPRPNVHRRGNNGHNRSTSTDGCGWKPWTLKIPALTLVIIMTLVLAGVIETLSRRSQANGGLAMSSSSDGLSTLTIFSYNYLPTIIAVLYNMYWAFIDLDTKRMQPFFELSRSTGATARNSLFLDYPFEFVVWVPWKAARRRHWPVFLSGSIVVLIFLLITPLQGAMMRVGPISLRSDMPFNKVRLPLVSDQAISMDLGLLSTGYSTSWLDQPVPPFTTRNYALLPIASHGDTSTGGSDANITVTTTKLSTSLSCWPAVLGDENQLDNGKGCIYSDYSPRGQPDNPYEIVYIGYFSSPESDYALASPSYPESAKNQFLALWSYRTNISSTRLSDSNMSASFCETSYVKQNVSATLSAIKKEPYDEQIVPLGPEQALTESEFNITAFEYLLGNGSPIIFSEVASGTNLRDTTFMNRVEQYPRLRDTGIHWPMTPLTGYALAGQNQDLAVYSDQSKLHDIFEGAHRLLFSIAVNKLTSDRASDDVLNRGSVAYTQYGVIINRTFAIAVESLLLLVAVLTSILAWACWKSPSKLQREPGTIAGIVDMVRYSHGVKLLFIDRDVQNEEIMERELAEVQFMLCHVRRDGSIDTVLRVQRDDKEMLPIHGNLDDLLLENPEDFAPARPSAMKVRIGVTIFSILAGAIGLLIYLKWLEMSNRGIPLPTKNDIALQILEKYLPMVFATSFEPIWVFLNRMLCLFQPFKDLWRGHSPAARSIDARYTTVPPQLAAWRAMRSGHLLLAFLCLVALMGNVLAVSLSALFNEIPTSVDTPGSFKQTVAPSLSTSSVDRLNDAITSMNNPYQDNLRVIAGNLSDKTPLPSWLTNDYYFLPVDLGNDSLNGTEELTIQTTGVGAVPSCLALDAEQQSQIEFSDSSDVYNASFVGEDGLPFHCSASMTNFTEQGVTGLVALESASAWTGSMYEPSDLCRNVLLFSWKRGMADNGTIAEDSINSTLAFCQPRIASALFDVTVDPSGHIIRANRTSDFQEFAMGPGITPARQLLVNASSILFGSSYPTWHNDSVSRSWVTYFMKLDGSKDADPSTAPDLDLLIPKIESVYKRTFAALLQQNPTTFDELNASSPTPLIVGNQRTTETKIFMSDVAFGITVAVLVIDAVAVVLIYWQSRTIRLPRVPATIGSIIGYIAGSSISNEEWKDRAALADKETFTFGRFIGTDGKPHIGIEVD